MSLIKLSERHLAMALEAGDWSGVSIGGRELIAAAIDALTAKNPDQAMTTNQTIDGVPRELLDRLIGAYACHDNNPHCHLNCDQEAIDKLRALLDEPSDGPLINEGSTPTPQPQGEPVAWSEVDVLDFISVALRHADYSGLAPSDILDGLRYMAEKGKPAFYAEQPALVAVSIDDNVEFEKWWMSTPILRKQKIQIAQEAWFARANLSK